MSASARMSAGATTLGRLVRLMVWLRFRMVRNLLRHRRGRAQGLSLALLVGLLTSLAYVGLFSQSFGAIVAATDLAGQAAALSLIVGTILFGTLAAKAASGEAALAGSPENELLLARPVSLASLVVARSLSEAIADPFGALFIFPVLLAAALTWGLGPTAAVAAALTSMIVQVGVSAAAQVVQLVLVRYVRPQRRRVVWMALRLVASLALAALWMTGTWVLRAPRALAAAIDPWRTVIARTPGAALVRPLLALRLGQPLGAVVGLALLAAATVALLALAFAIARRASRRGWEEAGAPWAEANPQVAPISRRPVTAATKDFRLIVRDRTQLLALLVAPIIFVGIQIFGAVGWVWMTASLQRVAVLSFSLCLYMATLGPLAHMQAERRSFWILRTVPVSIGRLMFAKARTWALALGTLAGAAFLVLSAGVSGVSIGERIASALWVAAGAGGMAFIAVALACQSADLSDDQRPAIGPATIYLFLLVGALYNVVLGEDGPARWRWLALYLFVGLSLWSSGMKQAEDCLDPETHRRRMVRLGDAAIFVLLTALAGRAVLKAGDLAGEQGTAVGIAGLVVAALLGAGAAIYLWRRPGATPRMGSGPAVVLAVLLGAAVGLMLRHEARGMPPAALLATLPLILGDELIFRGTLQRALEERWASRRAGRWAAVAVTVAIAVLAAGAPLAPVLAVHTVASLLRTATGRTSAAFLARATVIAVLAFLPGA
jgi:hypothetical protein